MKKFVFIILFSVFILPIFGFYREYFVEIENKEEIFLIKMKTFKEYSSIRPLKLMSMNVEKPTIFQDGAIFLQVVKIPMTQSFLEKGPYKGVFIFRKGQSFPDGYYNLIINNEDYGFLIILGNKIYFDPINCL